MCISAIYVQTGLRAMAARDELQYRKKRKAAIIIQASLKPHIDDNDLSFFVFLYLRNTEICLSINNL